MRKVGVGLWGFFLIAQPIDITQQRIDPLTFTFEDGRTTLDEYVIDQIRRRTRCCGIDNVWVELRFNPDGTVKSVGIKLGENKCYTQSIRDILLSTRWKVENIRVGRPLYREFRLNEDCGPERDNKYLPISPTPPALAEGPSAPPAPTAKPKPEESPPPTPKAEEPSAPSAELPTPPPPPVPEKSEIKPSPQPTPLTQVAEDAPSPLPSKPNAARPHSEPARKGYQPGPEPPTEARPPNPPALVGALPADTTPKPLRADIPSNYQSTGEKRPPNSHLNSFLNTTGPRYSEPDYIHGPVAKAIYLKQEYRKQGVCGLVQVLLEIAIDAQGNLRGYRILRANTPEIAKATPQVLKGLRYKPVPLPMVFYTEFKIDVDCQSDQRKVKLDTIPDFLANPEGKIIQPSSKPERRVLQLTTPPPLSPNPSNQ
ncbi:MAG: hypothetical protein NZ958_05070 [Bacteroidia bacterium]|nr:hypothetical protein [Bacteroidia bacterium]MDW8089371.1 hypothetical protein [Bacteroidia bacterium]